ncbi:Asp23/Gls24 family envelope stress response protein [Amycolatopsis magusensis]|uniref:Asp23/Gls24 family envelope stress response protein n=1 Tax=Amycolatopsis magusensis TaxID=882444 RepID=UPI003C2ED36C
MSSATANSTTSTSTQPAEGRGSVELVKTDSTLVTDEGVTSIADVVVQKIAGLAAREVRGVHALGGGAARAFGALRERIPGASASVGQGVSVEVGEKQAAVDLELVAEYGVGIAELSKVVRRTVIASIERMTGLEVVEVNIHVNDVHFAEDDAEGSDTTRVR